MAESRYRHRVNSPMRFFLFAATLMLAACQAVGGHDAASPSTHTVAVPGDHVVKPGQSLTLPDRSTLTYVRVVADSRCRPEVQCIRAGDADIQLQWISAAGITLGAALNSDPRNQQQAPSSTRFGPWQVALASLDWQTPPAATVSITPVH